MVGVTVSPFSHRLRLIWPWPHHELASYKSIDSKVSLVFPRETGYLSEPWSEWTAVRTVHAQQSEGMMRPSLGGQGQNSLGMWLDEFILTDTAISNDRPSAMTAACRFVLWSRDYDGTSRDSHVINWKFQSGTVLLATHCILKSYCMTHNCKSVNYVSFCFDAIYRIW